MSYIGQFYPEKGLIIYKDKSAVAGLQTYKAVPTGGNKVREVVDSKKRVYKHLIPYEITFAIGSQQYTEVLIIEATNKVNDYARAFVNFAKIY